jgi:hypothetical protein
MRYLALTAKQLAMPARAPMAIDDVSGSSSVREFVYVTEVVTARPRR